MAQSIGNYITIEDYLKNHSVNSLRILCWQTQWTIPMDLTSDLNRTIKSIRKKNN